MERHYFMGWLIDGFKLKNWLKEGQLWNSLPNVLHNSSIIILEQFKNNKVTVYELSWIFSQQHIMFWNFHFIWKKSFWSYCKLSAITIFKWWTQPQMPKASISLQGHPYTNGLKHTNGPWTDLFLFQVLIVVKKMALN